MPKQVVGKCDPVLFDDFIGICIEDLARTCYQIYSESLHAMNQSAATQPSGKNTKQQNKKKKQFQPGKNTRSLYLARALAEKSMRTRIDSVWDPEEWFKTLNKKGGNWCPSLNIIIPPDMDDATLEKLKKEWQDSKRTEERRVLSGIDLAKRNGLKCFISERLSDAEEYPNLIHLFPDKQAHGNGR